MAYVSKEKKAAIAALLKTIVPKHWKYTLAVKHHSRIEFNLSSSDVDFLNAYNSISLKRSLGEGCDFRVETHGFTLSNEDSYYRYGQCVDMLTKEQGELIAKIFEALNLDNYNNSDSQSDYFDVGHYVAFHVGHAKPYALVPLKPLA